MTAAYWEIGRRTVETEKQGADQRLNGEALIQRLAVDPTIRPGRCFSATNLKQMRSFHLALPSVEIGQTLPDQFVGAELPSAGICSKGLPSDLGGLLWLC